MIAEHLHRPFEYAAIKRRFRTSFYVQGGNGSFPAYAFIELDSENKGIRVGFHPRSIDLAYHQFETSTPKRSLLYVRNPWHRRPRGLAKRFTSR